MGGYTTAFEGRFELNRLLTPEHQDFLTKFAQEEHYPGEKGMPSELGAYNCQWRPTADGTSIVWDGEEKFYCYVEWLQYLIDTFLKPWGYVLNGAVRWQGDGYEGAPGKTIEDEGILFVRENIVESIRASVAFAGHDVSRVKTEIAPGKIESVSIEAVSLSQPNGQSALPVPAGKLTFAAQIYYGCMIAFFILVIVVMYLRA